MPALERRDGAGSDRTALRTGHECPDCGATVVNGQGLYTCFECEFTLAPTDTGTERTFDHPVFHLG